jgi:site-specific recombinase XerD
MLRCGLRISEVCRLTWTRVDLSQGTLLICDGKGQVDRTAYLSPDLEQALRLWQMRRGEYHYIFASSQFQTSPIHCKTVSRMMAKYLEQAGIIRHYTPHSLRHTFATQMLNAGVTLEVLKELMGHRSLQMTLCYAQLYETTKRQQYDQAMTRIEKRQAGLRG